MPNNAATPQAVYFVRASVVQVPQGATSTLHDGDRILSLVNDVPHSILQWSASLLQYTTLIQTFPSNVLVVVENSGAVSWWSGNGTAWFPLQAVIATRHLSGIGGALRIASDWNLATLHAFVVLTRRADDLYAAIPMSVISNLGVANPTGWTWTYPLSLTDGTDRFDGPSATDGLIGVPHLVNGFQGADYACVRRQLAPRPLTDPRPPEYIRVNLDMGVAVVMKALAWAMFFHGAYPTITVHGSNDPAFYVDNMVDIPVADRVSMGLYSKNKHVLQHNATLLWQLGVNVAGSGWTATELAAGTGDVYLTRFASDPRYTRLFSDGGISGTEEYMGWNAGHVFPTQASTFLPYRYYAMTVSVGLVTGSQPLIIEIQEFQPLVDAPEPAATVSVNLYARSLVTKDSGLYTIRLNRTIPGIIPGAVAHDLGYIEVWDNFQVRSAFHQGQTWSAQSFPTQPGMAHGQQRRASVTLTEVLLPRYAFIRSVNMAVTTLPFLWCFVRHPAMQPVGDQSTIGNRLLDPTRVWETYLQPPNWTFGRDTVWFQLSIPGARIPGEASYIGLSSNNVVQVQVTDTIGSGLPEFCFILPSGEILDFVQYDSNIALPDEVPHDEWACISTMLTVQFEEPPPKRQRS